MMCKKYVLLLIILLIIGVAIAWICIDQGHEETNFYDLKELERYFEDAEAGDAFNTNGKSLHFSEVNQQYPANIVQDGKYSVYDVNQGGRFYVFWADVLDPQTYEHIDYGVYSAIYLHGNQSPDEFDSLQPGRSTAEDVQKIDPNTEFNFTLSHAIYSCSYLNEEEVLQIKYHDPEASGYAGLVVEEIKVVSRASSYSSLAMILPEYLP